MDDFVTRLEDGWAALLALAGNDLEGGPTLLWEPAAPYPANTDATGRVPIYTSPLPHDRHRAVSVTAYPVEESEESTDDIWAIQVRTRGLPDQRWTTTEVDDLIFRAVQSLERVTVGGIPVTLVWRNSSGPMGMDENRRHEWTSNYYMHTTRPTKHRDD